ncbi:MAG: hypothetical protein ACP5GS_03965 [Nitrososphaeria archaeon]
MKCENCAYYRQHPLYNFMGYCEKKGSAVFPDQSCPEAIQAVIKDTERLFEDYGWAYCMDCGTIVFDSSELKKHISLGHSLTQRFLEDEVATYESPGGD